MTKCLIAMVAAFGLVLAACGSGSADVASLDDTEDTEKVGDEADGFVDGEAAVLAFTQCMREQGIEYEDPVVDSDGYVQKPQLAEGVDLKKDDLTDKGTWDACAEHLEGVTFAGSRGDKTAAVDEFVELASCLRESGFDVDDPTVETLEIWLEAFRAEFDFDDADAHAAYEACTGTKLVDKGAADKGTGLGGKE